MQGILDHGYDGNEGWAVFAAGALVVLAVQARRVLAARRAGRPIVWPGVAMVGLVGAGFVVLALAQILSHPDAWGRS